jgi:hypothetical protein
MSNAVSRMQRFTKAQRCPICQGYEQDQRGKGVRCFGFVSTAGDYAHCSRDEYAGTLPLEDASLTYAHRLVGDCRCGVRHDPSPPPSARNGHEQRRIETTYNYVDAQGTLLYQAVRYRPKGFSQRRPDGQGGWINNLVGAQRVLYRLPAVLNAIANGRLLCIAEGEADVDALWQQGYAATTNAMGAKKWRDEYSQTLQGASDVVIFGDHDADGRAHVQQVSQSLQQVGIIPRIAQLDGLPEHGDVRDWLQTHTQDDLARVIADAPAAHEPQAPEDKPEHGWQVFTLADAYRPREYPPDLVEGLFPQPSVSIVYGAPGTLKTLLLLDMLACIAAGRYWLEPLDATNGLPRGVQQASVLWADFDNGPRRMHERVAAIGRAYGLSPTVPLHYVSMPSPWLDASHPVGLAPLEAAIERYQAHVVIIDNLLLIKGSIEENSAGMGVVMAYLRQLAERYDCVVIPLHHQRKDHGNGGRAGDRLRGHSSIEASIDLGLLVERDEGSSVITLQSTKTRGADVQPFGAMFTYEHAPGTSDLFKARFYGVSIADEHSDRAIERAVRDVLHDGAALLKTELCSRIHGALPKIGINRIRGVVDRMAAQHHLHRHPGPKGGEYLSAASKGLPR